MIKRLQIKHFQSHNNTTMDFSPGVNVITGPNMSGKSSILRAIRLVASNLPGGSDYVTWGNSKVEIILECDKGTITRIKGNRTNEYILDGSTFSGFGRTIPEEIVAVLGTAPIILDDSQYELNYADAHSLPFLISETDSVKGKLFTQLAASLLGDLGRLDIAITTTNSKIRADKIEERLVSAELEAEVVKLESFKPLIGIDRKLGMCNTLLNNAHAVEEELAELCSCRDLLIKVQVEFDQYDSVLTALDLTAVQEQKRVAEALLQELAFLVQLNNRYKQVSLEAEALEACLSSIPEKLILSLTDIKSDCADANILVAEVAKLETLQISLMSCNIAIDYNNKLCSVFDAIPDNADIVKAADELVILWELIAELEDYQRQQGNFRASDISISKQLNTKIEELTKLLTENKKCPVCLSTIDDNCIAAILKEVTDGSKHDYSNGAGSHS